MAFYKIYYSWQANKTNLYMNEINTTLCNLWAFGFPGFKRVGKINIIFFLILFSKFTTNKSNVYVDDSI